MDARDTDLPTLVRRIEALAAKVIARNHELKAEVADLHDHIEGLTTKLTAAQTAHHTLTQQSELEKQQLADSAERDTQRLERIRAELDAYLSEIDRRLEAPPTNADHTN